tara:strand:- start:7501 stop:8820 length:1320 start_codon:yes stop_codon:yes gene_type:complete
MFNKLKKKYKELDEHTSEVIYKSIGAIFARGSGMLIALGLSVFLGRTIGAEGLGIISLSNRIASLALIFCLLGVSPVLVKNVAIGYNLKDWKTINSYMHTSYVFNAALSIIVVVILILIIPWLTEVVFKEPQLKVPLIIAIVALVPQTFSRIFSSGINGFRKIWQSNLVDNTLSVGIVSLIILIFYYSGNSVDVINVAIAYGISRIIVSITMGVYWKKIFKTKDKPELIFKDLIKPAIPLFWVSMSSVIAANADAIMLGWLGDLKQVGLYTVPVVIAMLTSFFLKVSNSVISPKLAGLYAEGKKAEMEKMVQQTTKGLIFIAFVPLLIFIIWGKQILGLWGEEFVVSYPILLILSIGQFFNISTGCSGMILIMCGYEKTHGYISIIFLVLYIPLNYVLILNHGAIGAAIAAAASMIGANIVKLIMSNNKTGISTLPIFK